MRSPECDAPTPIEIRAQSGLRPQLSAAASYDRLLASEFEDVFDTGATGPSCPPFALNPQAALDARVAEIERAIDCGAIGGGGFSGRVATVALSDLPFGRKNTWRASLSFSQNLYSGGRNGAQVALAAAGHESAELGVTTTRAQLLFEVTQAYYDALLGDRLVIIAASTLEQAGATLRQVEAGLSAGTQPEFEVLRARVTRDTQQPVLIRQRVNRELAFLRLKRLLDLPADTDLQLADALADENLPPPPVFVERVSAIEKTLRSSDTPSLTIGSLSLPERIVIEQASATVRTREASLRLTEAQRMPTVSLISNYSRIAYPENFLPSFNRSNWSVGVSMSMPILTGGRQRGDELIARADLDQARLQQQQVEEFAALDTRSAWAELLAARAAWESTAGTVQQADRAYEIADVRYGAGVSTQLELSDARLQRQQAEANRALAARDLQIARARVALLPDLPIGNALPTTGGNPVILPTPTPSAPVQQPSQGGGQIQECVRPIPPVTGRNSMSTRWSLVLVLNLAVLAASCSQSVDGESPAPEPLAVQIGAENVVSVESGTIIVGPIISGELTPTREATVRAELGGAILEVAVEEAQAVSRGALLARIETRTLDDARQSAASSLRSAENQLAVARRETERTERLVEAGALAARELDVARNTVSSAEAVVADARSRLASAERSLGDTTIRAPFTGIVASRNVHTGDVVTPGVEMFRIIDPSSMRLEASVPSEDLSVLRIGATVDFTVRGYDRSFTGRIERIAPQADPATQAGADLRGDSQPWWPIGGRSVCRGASGEQLGDRIDRAIECGEYERSRTVGIACAQWGGGARRRHAGTA